MRAALTSGRLSRGGRPRRMAHPGLDQRNLQCWVALRSLNPPDCGNPLRSAPQSGGDEHGGDGGGQHERTGWLRPPSPDCVHPIPSRPQPCRVASTAPLAAGDAVRRGPGHSRARQFGARSVAVAVRKRSALAGGGSRRRSAAEGGTSGSDSDRRRTNVAGKRAKDKQAGAVLRHDPETARSPSVVDSGLDADFHALRHTLIMNMVTSRLNPKTAQSLARRSTIDRMMGVST